MTDKAEAARLVDDFAQAAHRLCAWWVEQHDDIDALLTRTYPKAIDMSFDEFAAELDQWQEDILLDTGTDTATSVTVELVIQHTPGTFPKESLAALFTEQVRNAYEADESCNDRPYRYDGWSGPFVTDVTATITEQDTTS